MIDYIALGFILIAVLFGLIRGIVSQIMALVGLAAAYFWAPKLGHGFGSLLQHELGCSRFMADKAAIFLVGVAIYIMARLMGFFLNKMMASRIQGYSKLNRLGGAFLGGIKGASIVAVLFFFVALVPKEFVGSWMPKLLTSQSYKLAIKYNPMGSQRMLEKMRGMRAMVQDAAQKEKFVNDPELEKVLKRHDLENAMSDKNFIHSLEEGDFEELRKTENIEKLMNDGDLENLLDKLSKKKG